MEWDVTSAITTAARVNDLKFVVRNTATNGKKIKVDRVYVVVTYSTTTSSTSTSTTLLTASSIPVLALTTITFGLSRRRRAPVVRR